MKISFDTETDNYEDAVATLQAAFGISRPSSQAKPSTVSPPGAEGARDGRGFWNRERLEMFARWLAPGAAEAVRYIAAHAPTTPVDDAIEYMGRHLGQQDFSGQQMGGLMSSVGFSWKGVPDAEEPPLETDYRRRVYRMDPGVAAMLREIMGAPGHSASDS
jgi:hypothetical protein